MIDLAARDEKIIRLVEVERMSYNEAARSTRCTRNVVSSVIRRYRQRKGLPTSRRPVRHRAAFPARPFMQIGRKPGGCLPGTLYCHCGRVDLAVWDPTLGAYCEHCGTCLAFAAPYSGPAIYAMMAGPLVEALVHDR